MQGGCADQSPHQTGLQGRGPPPSFLGRGLPFLRSQRPPRHEHTSGVSFQSLFPSCFPHRVLVRTAWGMGGESVHFTSVCMTLETCLCHNGRGVPQGPARPGRRTRRAHSFGVTGESSRGAYRVWAASRETTEAGEQQGPHSRGSLPGQGGFRCPQTTAAKPGPLPPPSPTRHEPFPPTVRQPLLTHAEGGLRGRQTHCVAARPLHPAGSHLGQNY